MAHAQAKSNIQDVLDEFDKLPFDEQSLLLKLIRKRTTQQRRTDLVKRVAESDKEYARGKTTRGTADDLMKELSD
jgi:hypothetical protein